MKQPIKKAPTTIEAQTTESREIVPQQNEIASFNVENLMAKAIEKGLSPETMEKFLAMRQQLKAEWAKEQYTRAMAMFQSECPTIVKTKGVKTKAGALAYKYAPIESIVEQVKPYLQKNGFSYSTNMEVLPAGVKVTCKVTHIAGHSENSEMEVPLGERTQIMSASQVTAAASTFAKRYAFCNAFGILTGDEDTDARPMDDDNVQQNTGNSDTSYPPSEKQLKLIQDLIDQMRVTPEKLYDLGYDLKNLTGGKDGTASELIGFLKNEFRPENQITIEINGFTTTANTMIGRLNQAKDPAELIDLKKMLTSYRQEGRFTKEDLLELKKVYEKAESEIMPKEEFQSDSPSMQKMKSAMDLAKNNINKVK